MKLGHTGGRAHLGALCLASLAVAFPACSRIERPLVDTPADPELPACALASPLRRLTPQQYENTVRSLFPAADLPELVLTGNPPSPGLDNAAEGQHPSPLLTYELHQNAVEIAARVVHAWGGAPCRADGGDDPLGCAEAYLAALLPRAFRRPVTDEEALEYRDFVREGLTRYSFSVTMELALQAVLQDPAFLYLSELPDDSREPLGAGGDVITALDDFALASRLSYFVWNDMPDAELFRAADAGELREADKLAAEVQRLLADERAEGSVLDFARQVFEIGKVDTIVPWVTEAPLFSEEIRTSLRQEMERMVSDVLLHGSGTLSELLLTNEFWVNEHLAEFYGVTPPEPGVWERRTLNSAERAGILTTAGFLASHAVNVNASPVRRGVFVLSRLLCSPPPPPNASVDTNIPPDTTTPRTNRERFEAHVADPSCVPCHASIDGIGFGFEGYDALGRFRTEDNGFPVDDSGQIELGSTPRAFRGAVELAHLLATDPDVEACQVRWWLSYALGRGLTSDDPCALEDLEQKFSASGGNIKDLLFQVATSEGFRYSRRAPP